MAWLTVTGIVIICLNFTFIEYGPQKSNLWRNIVIGVLFAIPFYATYYAGENNLTKTTISITKK